MEDNQKHNTKVLREDYQILKDCIDGMYREYRELLQELMISSKSLAFWSALSLLFFFGELDLNLSKVGTEQMGTASFQGIQITGLTKQKLFSFFVIMISYSLVRFIAPTYKLFSYSQKLHGEHGQSTYFKELFKKLRQIEKFAAEAEDIIALDARLQRIRARLAANVPDMTFKVCAPMLLAGLALYSLATTDVPLAFFIPAALIALALWLTSLAINIRLCLLTSNSITKETK